MTRTFITDAEGTVYEAISAKKATRRKIIRRTITGTITVITALFLSAAIIGVNNAAHTPQGPNTDDYRTLRNAQKANPHSDCFFEWNEVQNAFEVICPPAPRMTHTASSTISLPAIKKACKVATKGMKQDCYALYLRKAWADPRGSYTPDGKALVKECISQYRGVELADCFTQEIG